MHRCEIWEVNRDSPEPITQGHSAKVYGVAFHPKKPYKFATACDSKNVFMWSAKRRQLLVRGQRGARGRPLWTIARSTHHTSVVVLLLKASLLACNAEGGGGGCM